MAQARTARTSGFYVKWWEGIGVLEYSKEQETPNARQRLRPEQRGGLTVVNPSAVQGVVSKP